MKRLTKRLSVRRTFTIALILIMLSTLIIFVPMTVNAAGTTFYVDSVGGNDYNNGTSTATAWRTLTKVNSTTFTAGDTILFKRGCSWSGRLYPLGSGSSGSPITIDAYGTGNLPGINCGGAYNEALLLVNQEYWVIKNLELTNTTTDTTAYRRGVYVEAYDKSDGVCSYIHLQNLYIHDVNGKQNAWSYDGGGIVMMVKGSTLSTKFDDILINGCTIKNINMVGIYLNNNWKNRAQITSGVGPWNGHTNVVISNNTLFNLGEDGIVTSECDGPRVEYNVVGDSHRKPVELSASPHVGLFPYNCYGSVYQNNEVYLTRTTLDGQGYDIDTCFGTTIMQYNYSHDNEGGFMLLCNGNNAENAGIVRYNISQNDRNSVIKNSSNNSYSTYIYNNTFYVRPGLDTMLVDREFDYQVFNDNFYNNIFYNLGSGGYSFKPGVAVFDYNCFYGNHPENEPSDAHKITSDPKLLGPGLASVERSSADWYKLQSTSPCINSGTTIGGNGGKDFWGNTVPYNTSTDRGAFEYQGVAPSVPATAKIDDQDVSQILYAPRGSWANYTDLGDYMSAEKHCNQTNAYAQFKFTGTGVKWIGAKSNNYGKANVYIDGVLQGSNIDCYNSTKLYQQVLYTKTGLASGTHTIKVVVNGTKNASSTGYYIAIDAFEVTTNQVVPIENNIALNRTAISDSEPLNYEANKGNDGDLSNTWCAADGGLTHWWKVDLGKKYNVTGSEVIWEFAGKVYKYKIETSLDNISWTLRVDKTGSTSTDQIIRDNFTANNVRYVKISVTGLDSGCWASFWDYKVFGTVVGDILDTETNNLAKNKTVTTDNNLTGAWAGNDGNLSTKWYAMNDGLNHWFKVDLGANYAISGTQMVWEKDGKVVKYKIEGSNDDTYYIVLVDRTNNTSAYQTITDNFYNGSVRYLRVTVTGLETGSRAALWEFKVFQSLTPYNCALNKTATTDSNPTYAYRGNDGNLSTRWDAADGGTGHWWKVDFGENCDLTGSEITFELAQAYKYKIEGSEDNIVWNMLADKTSNTNTNQVQTDTFAAIKTRYVRITITGGGWASFWEFKAFGGKSPERLLNIAKYKTASADSWATGCEASKANDDNITSLWLAADGGLNHWWKVDLGNICDISGTEVDWEQAGKVYKYKVETSLDNSTWTMAADRTGNTSAIKKMKDTFVNRARYVRITVTGLQSGCWAGFWEFRVFASQNLALGKPSTADSNPNCAIRGNDGDTSTRWDAMNSSPGHYWQVDLGNAVDLAGSQVYFEVAQNYKYKVEVSTNGTSWTMKVDKTGYIGTEQMQIHTYTANARYVRITFTGGYWPSFWEFKVFGAI